MALRIAKRLSVISPSPTLAVTAKAKALQAQGINVVSFGAGEPDFDTPQLIKDACIESLQKGFTKYVPSAGIPDLKKAIVEKLKRENGLEYKENEVLVCCGAKHALYNVVMALVDDGDEVIIPSPYWVTYPEQVKIAGGVPVFVETTEKDAFKLRPEALEKAITPRTRIITLGTPCNPTGAVLERADLEAIAAIAVKHDLVVISDEIYEHMIYDGLKHVSIATLPGMKERTIVINGHSKAYSMTGWRIGFAAGPKEVIDAMDALGSQSTSNVTSFAQKGAAAAYSLPPTVVGDMVKAFDERRKEITRLLNEIPGVRCPLPKGAFYVFPNVEGAYGTHDGVVVDSAQKLTEYLLEKAHVAVVQGEAFGVPGYIRLSYATSLENIREGCRRIKEALAR